MPQHLTPRMPLCIIQTNVTHVLVPDRGQIPLTERGIPLPLRSIVAYGEDLQNILREFHDLTSGNLGKCVDHVVTDIPFQHRLTRQQSSPSISPSEESLVLEEINKLVELGVVRETSQEPYLIPAFCIPKKTGDVRLVLDFRKLNSCVEAQPFLAVNKEHTIAGVRPYVVGSAIDLQNAYFQVELAPKLHHCFGVCLRRKFYVYERLPFGYVNSPSEFLRALRPAIAEMDEAVQSQVVVYMDDILLLSQSVPEHLRDLRQVLQILEKRGWRMRPDKCSFMQEVFDFLGHVVTPTGWRASASAIARLQKLQPPRTQTEWRAIKGWFQQLVRFVVNGRVVQGALRKAEESGRVEDWQTFLSGLEQHTVACTHAKETADFGIAVDSSGSGWGAVLLQQKQIICCASGLWPQALKHQISNHLEMEAVVKALRKFQPWIFGGRVTVFSDNASVASLANADNRSPFIRRRLDQIQECCPRLRFLPGHSNVLPDLLSRQSELFPDSSSGITASTMRERPSDLAGAHAGHFGVEKTWEIAKELGLAVTREEVKAYCRQCRVCQQFQPKVRTVPLGRLPESLRAGELISIDFVGPLRAARTGVRYVFTMVDHLTRLGAAMAFKRSTTASAQKGLEWWFRENGAPKRILSDRASYFSSPTFSAWTEEWGAQSILTAPHAHHSNGLNERWNQTLVNRLRRMLLDHPGKTWIDVLPLAVDCTNQAPHSITGFAPWYLWSGITIGGRQATLEEVTRDRQIAAWRTKEARDKELGVSGRMEPFQPSIGEEVWVFDAVRMERLDDKLSPFWVGPFVIVEQCSPHICRLRRIGSSQKIICHVDNLRPYV